MHEEDRSKPTNYFLKNVTFAYDLSSGGMGVYLYSVKNLVSGKPLSNREQNNIRIYNSNYLITSYILEWMHPGWYNGYGPKFESPRSKSNLRLLRETEAEYERLAWETMRLFLRGEEGLKVEHPTQPISAEELPSYLRVGLERGVVLGDNHILAKVKPTNDAHQLLVNIFKAGANIPNDFVQQLKQIPFLERFRDGLLKAATHKLGAMLAVSDQLAYDAYSSGIPIPYNFKPEEFDAEWKKMFGKAVPCFGDLYAETHTVFTSVASPEDELVKYLFPLNELPHLV